VTVLWWVGFGLAAWVVLAVVVALVMGPILKRRSKDYPAIEDGPS